MPENKRRQGWRNASAVAFLCTYRDKVKYDKSNMGIGILNGKGNLGNDIL